MRKLDIFNHLYPTAYFDQMLAVAPGFKDIGKRMRGIPMLVDLDERFRVMDRFGADYQQVLSIATPPIEVYAPAAAQPDLARRANDGMAALVQKYPDRFPAFIASLPLGDRDATMVELTRAIRDLGARGIQLCSNVNGRPLDEPEYLALLAAMADYDLPIFLHPYRGADMADYKTESKSKYEIWWTFGWPYETSAAMQRLVFSRLFDRLPSIRIVTHHLGAMVPYFEGRVGYGLDQFGARTADEDYEGLRTSMPKRPYDYFKMFWADTAVFGSRAATECGLKFFGEDQVVFASDAPFDPEGGPLYIRETIRVIDSLEITPEARRKIYQGNAERLFNRAF